MTYYKCDEKDKEIINKAMEITNTEYFEENGELKVEGLISCIEDLIYQIDLLNEELESEKQIRNDFYVQRSPYDIYCVNENDFH